MAGLRLRPRWQRIAMGVAASAAAAALVAGSADAKVKIYESTEQARQIGVVDHARCRVRKLGGGKSFLAVGKTEDRKWVLSVQITDFHGYDDEYDLKLGRIANSADFEQVNGPADYSTSYPVPGGGPAPKAGAVAFGRAGKLMGFGIYNMPNESYRKGVVVAGGLKCRSWRR